MKKLNKYKYIYLFIVVLALIGFISGYLYFSVQKDEMKTEIINKININEELKGTVNNLPKRIKEEGLYLVCGVTVLPVVVNVFDIYYGPFQLGFIFRALKTYNFKFSLLFCLVYHFIPLLFKIILIRLTLSIACKIIRRIVKRDNSSKKQYKLLLKKYLVVALISLFYDFLILIFSSIINSYLMTII